MDIREVKKNLGKMVRYNSKEATMSGQYAFNACTIRLNEKGEYHYQAELQQGNRSLLIVNLEDIQAL